MCQTICQTICLGPKLSDETSNNIQLLEALQFLFTSKRYKGAKGGRGSGKSHGFARAIVILGHQGKKVVLCAREVQQSIKLSVHRLLVQCIQEYGFDKGESCYHWNNEKVWHDNGTEIFFSGLWNNIDSIKSIEGIDICWIEEANVVSEDSWTKLIPTIRKPGSEIWFTYNPESKYDAVHQRFAFSERKDCTIATINWRDNPWISEELILEMERDKKVDFRKYLWTWEGFTKEDAGETVFDTKWYETYYNLESIQGNCYILVDPANSKNKNSDFTAMWVIVAAPDENLYIVDGVRDRFQMEKFDVLFKLQERYQRRHKNVTVGYERYGMQMDLGYIKERQEKTGRRFRIIELGSKSSGKMSKVDRIKRLVPFFSSHRIWFPETLQYTQLDGKTVDLIDLLKQELSIFHPTSGIPNEFHDDMCDCLSRICDDELGITFPNTKKIAPEVRKNRIKSYDPARFGFE